RLTPRPARPPGRPGPEPSRGAAPPGGGRDPHRDRRERVRTDGRRGRRGDPGGPGGERPRPRRCAAMTTPTKARPSAKPAIAEDELLEGALTPLISTVALGARAVSRAVTRVRIKGDLAAIPREGPVILAANHISNADPVIVGAWLTPALGRRIHWLRQKEEFAWARWAWR